MRLSSKIGDTVDLPAEIKVNGERGVLEAITGQPLPVLRCFGWVDSANNPPVKLTTRSGETLGPSTTYRYLRQDVRSLNASRYDFSGFACEFLLKGTSKPSYIQVGEHRFYVEAAEQYGTIDPHYAHLFDTDQQMSRDAIYNQGEPAGVNAEIRAFSALAKGRTLDFGCGNGSLIAELRERDLDAHGIELKTPRIEATLPSDLRPYITLYGGEDRLPYDNDSFDCIFSSEVIEHVVGIERYIPEFHRILRHNGKLIVTTPDISCIPSSFLTNTVPWHILESTHFNFFNAANLGKLFGTHFRMDQFYRFGQNWVNGTYVPGSIGFVATRKQAI